MYIVLLGACAIFSSQAQQRTGLHDAVVLNLTLAVIFCSIPVMILNAIYLGTNRFNKSAILNVSLAFGRLLLGVIGAMLLATNKDVASIGGILLVFVVVFGLFTFSEKPQHRKRNMEIFMRIWDAPMHVLKKYRLLVISSVMYAVTINFLLGMDMFMFGQFFSNTESADYAAVSVIGKLIFFFISPISIYLAAKQQVLISARPSAALKTSIGVSALILAVGAVLALMPSAIISLLIHRPAADINTAYLMLSLAFNAAVVLANHQIIEAIVGKRQKLVVYIAAVLLAINVSLFIFFKDIMQHIHGYAGSTVALGIPAITMVSAALILFVATHLFRKRRAQEAA
jgi:O-antigen/teichoic acid export membrane protein